MSSISRTAFRDSLNDRLNKTGLSVSELSRRTGVSKALLDKLRQERTTSTNVEDAMRVARFFGQSLEDFMGATIRQEQRNELADRIARMDPDQIAMIETLIRGIYATRAAAQQAPQSSQSSRKADSEPS